MRPSRSTRTPTGRAGWSRSSSQTAPRSSSCSAPASTGSCSTRLRRPELSRLPATIEGPVTRYTSATDEDRREMLAAIGVEGSEELFEQIPESMRLGRPLALPDGMGEAEVFERLAALAERNSDAEREICFIGAGMYDH